MGISEGCFIFDFASLPLEVYRAIYPTICTKVAVKHQSSSSSSSLQLKQISEPNHDPSISRFMVLISSSLTHLAYLKGGRKSATFTVHDIASDVS